MARHLSSVSAAHQLPAKIGRNDTPVIFDSFVSDIYLPHAKLRKQSWKVDERIARQHLSPTFGDKRLADVQRHEVAHWLHGLSEKGLAPATCNRILAVFKTICSLAETRGLLPAGQSPCAGVPSFKIRTQRERYLTRDEAQRLMRALEKSDRLVKLKKKTQPLQVAAISSFAALGHDKYFVAYAASKAALEAAAKTLAVELSSRNTLINIIRAAFVNTPMISGTADPLGDFAARLEESGYQPLGLIRPEEIAQMAAYLMSPAAVHISGAVFPVNAGVPC